VESEKQILWINLCRDELTYEYILAVHIELSTSNIIVQKDKNSRELNPPHF
jgi:hypothetical protein